MDLPIKAEVKLGERAVEKLIDAIVDTFSPATETMGLLGDVVRLARIEVAAQVTRRAKAIADARGLTLTAPPLKFLAPFYEKASIEDGDSSELVEMWANLLVAAGSRYDARQIRYTSILSEMSSDQAKILDGIARNYGGVIGEDNDPDALFYNFVESRLVRSLGQFMGPDADQLMGQITETICQSGVSVVLVQLYMKRDEEVTYDWNSDSVYTDSSSVDFELLRSVGLIDRVSTDFVRLLQAEVTVILYHMTELGFDFWSACRTPSPSSEAS